MRNNHHFNGRDQEEEEQQQQLTPFVRPFFAIEGSIIIYLLDRPSK